MGGEDNYLLRERHLKNRRGRLPQTIPPTPQTLSRRSELKIANQTDSDDHNPNDDHKLEIFCRSVKRIAKTNTTGDVHSRKPIGTTHTT